MARRVPTRRELTLTLEGSSADVERAFELRRGAISSEPSTGPVVRSFFDTDARDLREEGLSLWIQRGGSGALQVLAADGGAIAGFALERQLHETASTDEAPDLRRLPLRARGKAGRSTRPALKPVARAVFEQTRAVVERGDALVALALETGEVVVSAEALPIARIVLELERGEPAALFEEALALQRAVPALRPSAIRAEQRALDAEDKLPLVGRRARAIGIDADATLDAWLGAALGECVRHLIANVPGAASGVVDAVHQMRVGARALRTLLRLFRDVLPRQPTLAIGARVAEVARALGAVRDWDVLLAEVLEPMPEREPSLGALVARAEQEREQARAALRARLSSHEFAQLLLELGSYVSSRPWRAQPLEARTAQLFASAHGGVSAALAAAQRRIEKAARRAERPEDRHRLRVRIKQARYGAELAAPLLGRPARRYARRAARLQSLLGAETDAASARACVERLSRAGAASELTQAAAFARGWLARGSAIEPAELRRRLKRLARSAAELNRDD